MTSISNSLKSSWLEAGWFRASICKNATDDKLILSGFIYPAKAKHRQGLDISGSYEPDIQYGLFNPDHAYWFCPEKVDH